MNTKEFILEKEAEGVYVIRYQGATGYTPYVGYVTGGKNVWLAEMGRYALGYRKTRKEAVRAVIEAFEKPIAELQKEIQAGWHQIS